jgi:pyruvate formate lyase activating enzyme
VDTCGYVPRDALEKVMPHTDVFLYDLKAAEEETHLRCTGKSLQPVLENLRFLDACGKKIEVRIPYVPGHNSGEIGKMAEILGELQHLDKVRVLPYHNYAGTKYSSLDIEDTLPERLPTDEEIAVAKTVLSSYGIKVLE